MTPEIDLLNTEKYKLEPHKRDLILINNYISVNKQTIKFLKLYKDKKNFYEISFQAWTFTETA